MKAVTILYLWPTMSIWCYVNMWNPNPNIDCVAQFQDLIASGRPIGTPSWSQVIQTSGGDSAPVNRVWAQSTIKKCLCLSYHVNNTYCLRYKELTLVTKANWTSMFDWSHVCIVKNLPANVAENICFSSLCSLDWSFSDYVRGWKHRLG